MMIYHWNEFVQWYGTEGAAEEWKLRHKIIGDDKSFNLPDFLFDEHKIAEIESLPSSIARQLEPTTCRGV